MILAMNGIVSVLKINQSHATATIKKILIAKENMLATVIQVRISEFFFFFVEKPSRYSIPILKWPIVAT